MRAQPERPADTENEQPKNLSFSEQFLMWLKYLGFGGFVFLLVKGLLWFLVPYIAKLW